MSQLALSEIPTLTLLYKLGKIEATKPVVSEASDKYNDKISLIRNDITKLKTDAIVNAANESLLGGGGVDGAIHAAAGWQLLDECAKLDGCDTGDAKITGAYELPCKKVIHAVGPIYSLTKRQGTHSTLLRRCYTRSLDLAIENDCQSIAFSALSTGVYGYPSEEAAETAIQAIKGWLDQDESRAAKIGRIVFCQFMEKDEKAYGKFIPKYFPPRSNALTDLDTTGGEDVPNGKEAEAASEIPALPDVPQSEPVDPKEPSLKKVKLAEQP